LGSLDIQVVEVAVTIIITIGVKRALT